MSFEKLPAVEGSVACFTCGAGARSDLDMGLMIAVGFGQASYSRNGECLYQEGANAEEEDAPLVSDVEALALKDPDADWRISFFAPLYSAEYQRQAEGVWVLVSKDEGFA